ncbi:MAG: PAS domain S-box protein [Methanoregula sp.]
MYDLLYIDDDHTLLESSRLFLERTSGFTVTPATSAAKGLMLLKTREFDAIITDYEMPGMNGITFLKEVRRAHGDVPVIIFTGKGREDVVIEAINNGADFYLQKGGNPKAVFTELTNMIKNAIRRRKADEIIHINEQRLRMAQAIGKTGSWEFYAETGMFWGSEEAFRIFGISCPDDGLVRFDDIREVFDDPDLISRGITRLIETGIPIQSEFAIHPANSSSFAYIRSVAELISDQNSKTKKVAGVFIDITDRRKIEQDLLESEEKYRISVEKANEAVSIAQDGFLVYTNPSMSRLLGVPAEELQGQPFARYIWPGDRDLVVARYQRRIAGDVVPDGYDFRLIGPGGGMRWVSLSAALITLKGRPATLNLLTDITERKMAEETIRASEERYRRIVNTAQEGIWVVDASYKTTFVNTHMARLIGYDPEEMTGRPVTDFMFPEDVSDLECIARERMSGSSGQFERAFVKKDGSTLWTLGSSTPLFDEGLFAGSFSMFTDITARREAEMRLSESENRFRHVSAITSDFAFSCRTQPDGGYAIDWMAGSVEKITGYSTEEIREQRCWSFLVCPEDLPLFDRHVTGIRVGSSDTCELRILRKDGRVVWLQCQTECIGEPGDSPANRLYGGCRDITRQKQAEKDLAASEERFRSLYCKSPIAIESYTPDGQLIDVNPACCALFGIESADTVRGFNLFKDPNIPMDQIELLKSGKTVHFESKFDFGLVKKENLYKTSRSGKIFLDILITPVSRVEGTILEYLVQIIDITNRKQAETALSDNNRLLNQSQEIAHVGSWILEPATNRLTWSDEVYRIFGIEPGEFTGSLEAFYERIPWEERALIEEVYSRSISEGAGVYEIVHHVIRRDNGQTRTVRERGYHERDASGNIIRTIGMVHDITDTYQAEAALRENEELLREMLNNANDGIFLMERRPDGPGRYILVNDKATRMLGYTSDEILQMSPRDIVPPEVAKKVMPEVLQRLDRDGYATFESVHRRKDGSTYPVEVSTHTFRYKGKYVDLSIIRDITGRKNAEEALQKSRAQYREIVENISEVILTLNREGTITYISPVVQRIFGYTVQEVVGQHFTRFVHPDDIPLATEGFSQRLKGGFCPNEFRIISGDKEVRYIRTTQTPVMTGNTISAFNYVISDITVVKKNADELRESEEKYRALFESLPLGVTVSDKGGNIIESNALAEHILGISRQEQLSRQIRGHEWQVVRPDGSSMPAEEYASVRALGEKKIVSNIEMGIVKGNGEITWITVTAAPIPLERFGVIITYSDISGRKMQENALKESEEKYRALFAAESDAIFVVDQETGKILDCNNAAARLYGFTREELIGQPNTMVSAEEEATRANTVNPTKFVPLRIHRKKDGTPFPVEVQTDVITLSGRPVVVGAIRDITERKRAEDALRLSNQKLTLLSGITRHDIRNQLTSLNAYLNFSTKSIGNDEKTREFLGKAAGVAEAIRQQILFTKEYETLGASPPVWQNVKRCIEPGLAGLDLRGVVVDVSGLDNEEIIADPLLCKVFFNLADNALRHGGENLKKIRFSSQETGDGLLIVCEDDGDGIVSEEKELIFERGYGKNTGYGLFLIREILAITEISLRETGEPGKGSRFEMLVPKGGYRFAGPERP